MLACVIVAAACGAPTQSGAGWAALQASETPSPSTTTSRRTPSDLGAAYAPTSTLTGKTVAFNWTEHIKAALPKSTCAHLAATIDRHGVWFSGDGTSKFNQQDQERAFFENVTTTLCANPEQTDDEYMEILHGMLSTMRKSIGIHTHAAFWFKVVAGEISSICHEANDLKDVTLSETPSDEMDCTAAWGREYQLGPLQAVLAHEKFNLVEGVFIITTTMEMIEQGASFCTAPDFESKIAKLLSELEERLSYHKSSDIFDEFLASYERQLCTEPDANETDYDVAYEAMARYVDKSLLNEDATCSLSDDAFSLMPYLKNNPPDAEDVVMMFEGNVKMTISGATGQVAHLLSEICIDENSCVTNMCVDEITGEEDPVSSARIWAKLSASGLPYAIWPSNNSFVGRRASASQVFSAVPYAYHKLGPMCRPSSMHANNIHIGMCVSAMNEYSQRCAGESPAAGEEPIYDLLTSADLSKCSGAACKKAARAVISYQDLLTPLTGMRWDTVQMTQGTAPGQGVDAPLLDQSTWIFQRSCTAYESIVDKSIDILAKLPAVVSALREAAPQLEASCIAPPRFYQSPLCDYDSGGCYCEIGDYFYESSKAPWLSTNPLDEE